MRFVSVWQGSLSDAHKFIIENGLGPSFGQFVADTQMRGAYWIVFPKLHPGVLQALRAKYTAPRLTLMGEVD